MGYIDGGLIMLDIADKAHPKMISRWDYHPPNPGFTHTVVPFFDARPPRRQRRMHALRRRRLAKAGLDRRQPHRGKPGADRDLPDAAGRDLRSPRRPLRRAQSVGEPAQGRLLEVGRTSCSARSSAAVSGRSTCRTRTSRRKSAISCRTSPSAPNGRCQINDVFVDDRGIVFAVDRIVGGLYALEMDF